MNNEFNFFEKYVEDAHANQKYASKISYNRSEFQELFNELGEKIAYQYQYNVTEPDAGNETETTPVAIIYTLF